MSFYSSGNSNKGMEEVEQKMKECSGYLKKLSPSIIKGWQKRYFQIMAKGSQLAYYDKESSHQPKGLVPLENISKLQKIKKKEFEFTFEKRIFSLKCKDEDDRDMWFNNMEWCIKYTLEQKKIEQENEIANRKVKRNNTVNDGNSEKLDDKNIVGNIVDVLTFQTSKKDKWKNVNKNLLNQIQKEKQQQLFNDSEFMNIQMHKRIMNKKGIQYYLDNIDPDLIQNRLMIGFLVKKNNEISDALGINIDFKKVVDPLNLNIIPGTTNKFWYCYISEYCIKKEQNDNKQLCQSNLPPWMQLDTLYYFKYESKDDQSPPRGFIEISEILEIIVGAGDQKNQEYIFKLNLGEKIIELSAQNGVERDNWVQILRAAIEFSKKKTNPGSVNLKIRSIDQEIDIIDNMKETDEDKRNEDLDIFIDEQYQKFLADMLGNNRDTVELDQLLDFVKFIGQEMLMISESCVKRDNPREDILQHYLDIYHDNILYLVQEHWNRNYESFNNLQFLILAENIYQYQEKAQNYYLDARIHISLTNLIEIFCHNVYVKSLTLIDNLIKQDFENEPILDEDEYYITNSPFDLFKVLSENYELARSNFDFQELKLKLVNISKMLILYYEDLLYDQMLNQNYSVEQLIAICNNSVQFCKKIKDFQKMLQQDGLQISDVDYNLDKHLLMQNFSQLGNTAKDTLVILLFKNISFFFKCYFLELDIQVLLDELISKFKETFEYVHETFRRKIWNSFLENIIQNYIKTFMISCKKGQTSHLQKFIEKIEEDQKYLEEQFEDIIFGSQLQKTLHPLDLINRFLRQRMFFNLLNLAIELKGLFGASFQFNVIQMIFKVRGDFNSGNVKQDILKGIKQYFEENKQKMLEETKEQFQKYNNRLILDQVFTSIDEKEKQEQKLENQQKQMMKEVNQDLKEDQKRGSVSLNQIIEEEEDEDEDMDIEKKEKEDDNLKKVGDIAKYTQKKSVMLKKSMVRQSVMKVARLSRKSAFTNGLLKKKDKEKNIKKNYKVFKNEGQLLMKSNKNIFNIQYEKKFFRIRGNILYWYKNSDSNTAQNKIDLFEVDDVYPVTKNDKKFEFVVKDVTYKLVADTNWERNEWVDRIREMIRGVQEDDQDEGQNDVSNFEAIQLGLYQQETVVDHFLEKRIQYFEEQNQIRQMKVQKRNQINLQKWIEKQSQESIDDNYQPMNAFQQIDGDLVETEEMDLENVSTRQRLKNSMSNYKSKISNFIEKKLLS